MSSRPNIEPISSRDEGAQNSLMSAFGFDPETGEDSVAPEEPEQEAKARPEPEPKAKPEPEETPEEQAQEQEGEPEEEPQSTAEEDSEEQVEIKSLSELAEHLEVEPDYLMGLEARVKIDGEERTVPLKDVLSGYQTQQSLTRKGQSLAEERKQWQEDQQRNAQQLEYVHAAAAATLKAMDEQLTAREKSAEALREDEPERFAAEMFTLQRERSNLEKMRNEAVQGWMQKQQMAQQQAEQRAREYLAKEHAAVVEKVFPEWKDESKAKEGRAQVKEYLTGTYGLTNEELSAISDHRVLDLVKKAMAYDKGMSSKKVAEKKVAKVLRHPKSGKRVSAADEKTAARQGRFSTLKKTARGNSRQANHAAAVDVFEGLLSGE